MRHRPGAQFDRRKIGLINVGIARIWIRIAVAQRTDHRLAHHRKRRIRIDERLQALQIAVQLDDIPAAGALV